MNEKIQKWQIVTHALLLFAWLLYVAYAIVMYDNGLFNILLGAVMTIAAVYYFGQIVYKYVKQNQSKDEKL